MLVRDVMSRAQPRRTEPATHGLDRYGPEVASGFLVAEAMARRVTACGPDADLAEVAEVMLAHDVREVLVVDKGELLGVVSDKDLLRTMLRPAPDRLSVPASVALDDVWLHQPLELHSGYR
jgi:CBS domain-containing protein